MFISTQLHKSLGNDLFKEEITGSLDKLNSLLERSGRFYYNFFHTQMHSSSSEL